MTLYVRQYASTTRPLTRPIPYFAHETLFNKWTNTKIWNLKIHNKLCVFSNTHTVHTKLNVKSFLYTINASISTPPIGLIFVMNVQLYVGKTKILIFGRLIYHWSKQHEKLCHGYLKPCSIDRDLDRKWRYQEWRGQNVAQPFRGPGGLRFGWLVDTYVAS